MLEITKSLTESLPVNYNGIVIMIQDTRQSAKGSVQCNLVKKWKIRAPLNIKLAFSVFLYNYTFEYHDTGDPSESASLVD